MRQPLVLLLPSTQQRVETSYNIRQGMIPETKRPKKYTVSPMPIYLFGYPVCTLLYCTVVMYRKIRDVGAGLEGGSTLIAGERISLPKVSVSPCAVVDPVGMVLLGNAIAEGMEHYGNPNVLHPLPISGRGTERGFTVQYDTNSTEPKYICWWRDLWWVSTLRPPKKLT